MIKYVLIGWMLERLNAPTWVWGLFFVGVIGHAVVTFIKLTNN